MSNRITPELTNEMPSQIQAMRVSHVGGIRLSPPTVARRGRSYHRSLAPARVRRHRLPRGPPSSLGASSTRAVGADGGPAIGGQQSSHAARERPAVTGADAGAGRNSWPLSAPRVVRVAA